MAEYIDRDAVYTAFANACTDVLERASEIVYISGFSYERVIEILDNIPTVNVAPIKHGQWECVYDDSTGETDITCSHCKNTRTVNGCFVSTDGKSCYFEDDYCPYCGAKMDGGANNG